MNSSTKFKIAVISLILLSFSLIYVCLLLGKADFFYIFIFLICINTIIILTLIEEISIEREIKENSKQWQQEREIERKRFEEHQKQLKLQEEARKLEERLRKEQEEKAARELAEAEEAKIKSEIEYLRERAFSNLKSNHKNSLIIYSRKLNKIDFVKSARIEFAKFPQEIYEEANEYYEAKARKEFGYDKDSPEYRRCFDRYGNWKNISLNALLAYIRHNYTNYDFLCSQIGNDNEAYNFLKYRVNSLISDLLIILANQESYNEDTEEYYYDYEFYYEIIRDINEDSLSYYCIDKKLLDSWEWDTETKYGLR